MRAGAGGYARWNLRLVADRLVALEIIGSLSHETVRKVMRANELKPWLKAEWCIPPEHSGEFVCHLEDTRRVEVYRRPLNPRRPLVCIDELPHQLIAETRLPQAVQPGQRACYTCTHRQVRCDCENERAGVCNIFMVFAPLLGWRWTRVTAQRTYRDWAYLVRDLVDEQFPEADRLVLVLDNLNLHVGGALYETFPPAEAQRLLDKLGATRMTPPNTAVG